MSQPNRAKLTKGYVERIKAGAKDAFHWDTEVKGFGLRVVMDFEGTVRETRHRRGPDWPK